MTKFLLYSFLAILAFISVQVQSAVLPVSKEVALVETSTSSESSSTTIDTLGSSRVKRQGGCGCCGCGGGCGCCGCGGGGGGGCGCCCCRPKDFFLLVFLRFFTQLHCTTLLQELHSANTLDFIF
uniref:Uncharacterized protein n=1 Tax=Caenorhabditis japonica TaxID=281687 RepID=A0A8R1ERY5_CAEJA